MITYIFIKVNLKFEKMKKSIDNETDIIYDVFRKTEIRYLNMKIWKGEKYETDIARNYGWTGSGGRRNI